MKQLLLKRLAIVAFALCAVPSTLLAQKDKEKEKIKEKEKQERQQIIITRTGDKDEKTIIEIDGDKVKVNGKDVADLKDIKVHVNNLKMPNVMALRSPGGFNMTFDDHATSLFSVDSNRAMLGVVTEGDDKGAEISMVSKESAAEKAGLKKGDIITRIDNRKIEETDDVTDAVRAHKPGDKISITYLREGKEQKTTAELGRWKGIDVKAMTAPKIFEGQVWQEGREKQVYERTLPRVQGNAFFMNTNRTKLGLSVQDTEDGKGVKVLEVDEDGNAGKAGIKEDDVITHIDETAVNSADEIAKIMKDKKDQVSVRFQVNRSGKTQNIEVKIPRKIKTVDL